MSTKWDGFRELAERDAAKAKANPGWVIAPLTIKSEELLELLDAAQGWDAARASGAEPVAWRYQDSRGNYWYRDENDGDAKLEPLYASPVARQPLTEELIREEFIGANRPVLLTNWASPWLWRILLIFARRIERAHGIGSQEGERGA